MFSAEASTLAAGEARVVTVARSYPDPIEEVWDACTTAERITRWLMPVSGELRLGGRYQLENHAGGVIESCDPPRSFNATWEYGGDVSWVELRLEPEGDGTRFTLEHVAHVDDARWTEFGPGAVGVGWDSMLLGLTMHLESDTSITPAQGASPKRVEWSFAPNQNLVHYYVYVHEMMDPSTMPMGVKTYLDSVGITSASSHPSSSTSRSSICG